MRGGATAWAAGAMLVACGGASSAGPGGIAEEPETGGAAEAATVSVWNPEWGEEGVIVDGGADWVLTLTPRVTFRHVATSPEDLLVAWCARDDGDESLCKWTKVRPTGVLEKSVNVKIAATDHVTVTVFVRTKDGEVWSASDDAPVDAVPPLWDASVRFSAVPFNRQVVLSWMDGFSDANGLASYRLFRTPPGMKLPGSCRATAGLVYSGEETTYDDTFNLVNIPYGLPPYIYSVCALDVAGGSSKFVTSKAWPGGDGVPPEIEPFSVQRGDVAFDDFMSAKSVNVTLDVSDDRSSPENIKVSFATTPGLKAPAWSKWVAFDPDKLPTLKLGKDGAWTVAARAMDEWGNVSDVKSESFVLDTVGPALPKGAKLTVDLAEGGSVAASWPDFVDAGSGLAEYRVFVSSAGVPKCTGDAYESAADPSWSSTLDPGRYVLLVCAADPLGNVSAKGLSRVLLVR